MCIEDKLVCIRIHKNLFDRVYHILNRYILAHKYIYLEWQMTNSSNLLGYQAAIKQITNMPNLSIFLPNCWWHELPFASHSHRFWQLVPYLPWSHIESHFTPSKIKYAWWLICIAGFDDFEGIHYTLKIVFICLTSPSRVTNTLPRNMITPLRVCMLAITTIRTTNTIATSLTRNLTISTFVSCCTLAFS